MKHPIYHLKLSEQWILQESNIFKKKMNVHFFLSNQECCWRSTKNLNEKTIGFGSSNAWFSR